MIWSYFYVNRLLNNALHLEENTEIIVLCRYKTDGSIYRQVANECNKNHPDRNPAAHNLVQGLLKKFKETGPVACKPCLGGLSTIKCFVKLLQQKHATVLKFSLNKIRISHTKELEILKKAKDLQAKFKTYNFLQTFTRIILCFHQHY